MWSSERTMPRLTLLRVSSAGHRDREKVPGKEATEAGIIREFWGNDYLLSLL